ncbi:MAG: transcriptional repressor [Chloroflexi bacterium]|nr:transcriptional repressor [Chloroflexota bacterium]
MSCADEYAPQLRARGYRMTSQRLAILHVLHHNGGHLSPVEVYEQARTELPSLTETTVYRTLEFLAGNGLVRPALTGSGHCGNEMEVEHELLKSMYETLEVESGYKLTDSHLTFFGLCPNCQKGD